GTRQVVLIQLKEGRFEPREVKLGARSDTHVEVLSGVKEGELVVVAANFLIDAESNLKAAIGGFGSTVPNASQAASGSASSAAVSRPTALTVGTPAATSASMVMKGAGHQANGTIEEIDSDSGTVVLRHDPIPSLKWPAMTMEFKVANGALLKSLKPGAKVAFEFVERGQGEWVITGLKPAGN
ncbi:copper-binding protein, partial [bacterium]|nr:copper-binding protein [bacterium]